MNSKIIKYNQFVLLYDSLLRIYCRLGPKFFSGNVFYDAKPGCQSCQSIAIKVKNLTLLPLTLFGMGGDTSFHSSSFLDQILSAEYSQKFLNFLGGEN